MLKSPKTKTLADGMLKSPKAKTLADRLIEITSSMIDEIESKTVQKDEEGD